MPKGKANKSPRRKRLKRQGRLDYAKSWLPTYPGKNLIRGYIRHFAVDLVCAIKELTLLGVPLDPAYVARISENAIARKKRKKKQAEEVWDEDSIAREYGFAYIAGYTSGGAPYGITQKELDESLLTWQREEEAQRISRMRSPVVFEGPDNPFRTEWDEYTYDESWQGCEEPFELDCGDLSMPLEEHELLWQDSGCIDFDFTWQETGEVVTADSQEEFKDDPFQLIWHVAEEIPFSVPWDELHEPPFSISWNELSEERSADYQPSHKSKQGA